MDPDPPGSHEANRVAGSLSSGLHHARADRGNGFCTFNGLVVASSVLRSTSEPRGCWFSISTPIVVAEPAP